MCKIYTHYRILADENHTYATKRGPKRTLKT